AKPRRGSAVTGAHHLHRLAFTTVGRSPDGPLIMITDGITGAPELRRNARVGGILQHLTQLAMLYLVGHLHAELEIQAEIIDAPAFIDGQETFDDEARLHTQNTIQFHRVPA